MLIKSVITGKIIKKIVKIAVLAFVVLVTGLVALFTILRSPSFQELAGRIAAGYLSEKIGTEIHLDNLRINDLLNIEIQGLRVKDNHNNEIFRVDKLMVNTEYVSLREHILYFDKVKIDGGGFFLEWYPGDTMMNLDYLLSRLASDTVAPGTLPPTWEIRCKDFSADNLAFSFKSGETDSIAGINFEDLGFTDVFIDIKDVIIIGDSVSAYLDHIAFNEKSGFELLNFSGDARVSGSGIKVKGAQISTGNSSLDLDLDFAYNGYDKLGWFIDSVYINADIRSSLVTLADIGYFAPELLKMEDPVMISGKVHGPVSDFFATDLELSLGEFTEFEGEMGMKGLPDFYSTFVKLQIDELNTTPEDVSSFILPLNNFIPIFPPEIHQLGFTSVTGWYEGSPDNFITDLSVITDAGSVLVNGRMAETGPDSVLTFAGNLSGTAIHLGNIFTSEDLGTVNLEMKFEGSAKSVADLEIDIDGWIEDFEFRDYMYEKILIDGLIAGRSFNGHFAVSDSLIAFELDGLADFNGDVPTLQLAVDIEKAHLSQIHLADRSDDMNLSGKAQINIQGFDPDSSVGTITVDDFRYLEYGTTYLLNHLELSRQVLSASHTELNLRSDYIDGDIEGTFSVKNLVNHLIVFFLDKQLDPATQLALDQNPQNISFDFHLKDLSPVTSLFMPGLHISPGTVVSGRFDSQKSILEVEGNIAKLSVSGITIEELNFSGTTNRDDFSLELAISKLMAGDGEDETGIGIENLLSTISSGHDSVIYSLQWDNHFVEAPNRGSLNGFIKFDTINRFDAGILNAEALFNDNTWKAGNDNFISYDSKKIIVRDFKISKEDESFVVNGVLSDQPEDTLSVYFHKWSLANFNPLLEGASLELSGIIDGRFGVFRNQEITNVFAGLSIADFSLNDVYFGDAEVNTRWLEADQALALDLNIFSRGSQENPYKILGINGMYYPFDEKRNFDFDIIVQNLNISVLEPMLTSFSSHTDGFATGKLTLDGTLKKPLLLGRLKLQRAEMQIDYLNVIYSFSNEVVFTKDQIQFNELTVFDPNSNKAQLSGGIKHTYFKDMSLDLTIEPDKFMALNLNRYQNEVFYGKAFATGIVRLHGPFEHLTIEVDATTEKGTNVTIPINYSVDVSQTDFIVFTGHEDTLNPVDDREVQVVGVSLDIAMNVTRSADIEIILPGNIGNIKAKGSGNLRLGVDPNYYLTLNGSYKIYTGLFVFSLEELVSRRFEILEGSSISWTGDLNDAEVSITARYRLRTSLEGLGITLMDPEASSEKVIVNTDIRMTGNLFNPNLSFGITFPNMQEQTKQAVYAVLDTNDAGLMNQQAISLLVLGSFSSTGTSSVSNPVNPAAIVSNTLSNMLSQISNDFNVGINYVPGDQVSSEQLEVALSTQLLDDRLIIDGNFDVTGSSTNSQKTSSIVGDINVEYKLTPDGRFRVKAFNRSNDLTLFNDYAPYTQGVGIFWRKDFNTLGELFRKSGKEAQQKDKK